MNILEKIKELRSQSCISNNYLPDGELVSSCEEGKTSIHSNKDQLLIGQNVDYGFDRLSVFFLPGKLNEKINLKKSVFEFVRLKSSELKSEPLNQFAEQFGLMPYKTFLRMYKLKTTDFQHVENSLVERAKDEDLMKIKQFLEDNFDIFAERIPSLDELGKIQEWIYLIKEKGEIAALLVSEIKGVTEELRYWLVREDFRSKGYGGILMRYFLQNRCSTKRFTLWVESTNVNAIQKYKHYGFLEDKLVNHIYITKDLL